MSEIKKAYLKNIHPEIECYHNTPAHSTISGAFYCHYYGTVPGEEAAEAYAKWRMMRLSLSAA